MSSLGPTPGCALWHDWDDWVTKTSEYPDSPPRSYRVRKCKQCGYPQQRRVKEISTDEKERKVLERGLLYVCVLMAVIYLSASSLLRAF